MTPASALLLPFPKGKYEHWLHRLYADDTLLYLQLNLGDSCFFKSVLNCLEDFWVAKSFLQLNEKKLRLKVMT